MGLEDQLGNKNELIKTILTYVGVIVGSIAFAVFLFFAVSFGQGWPAIFESLKPAAPTDPSQPAPQ